MRWKIRTRFNFKKLIHLKSPSSTDVFISTEKTKLGSEDKIQFILGGHFSNTSLD